MSALFGIGWFLIGIVFSIAGKDFLEVCACFILFGIFMGVQELHEMREDLEDTLDE